MSRCHRVCLFILLCATLGALVAPAALAQERILSYSSDITVRKDGTMLVTETIRALCMQVQIRHGIYRDFPTRYKDKYGNNYVVGFEITRVTRDGAEEPYHTEGMSNGERIYIGDADTLVSTGIHTYTLTYETNRQLGFFPKYDELYWNVTGNGWVFPIDHATATVTLPPDVPASKLETRGWTGAKGSKDQNFKASVDSLGRAIFETTQSLGSYEGLTIAVKWPKGYVEEPTTAMRVGWLMQDNRGLLVCLLGLFIVCAYYVWAQMKVGIDPAKGAIVPQWDPPDGLSPAAVRFVSRMGIDHSALSAALINAAVKGAITISKPRTKYTITRNEGEPKVPLSKEESAAVEALVGTRQSIELDQDNHTAISGAIEKFSSSLQAQFGKGYFATHGGYTAIGVLLSIMTLIAGFIMSPTASDDAPIVFLLIWLTVWTAGTTALVAMVIKSWMSTNSAASGCSSGCMTIFALPFVLAEIFVAVIVATSAPIALVLTVLAFGFINVVFYKLLKAYTKAGRAVMDKAEGLRMYMRAAEQERLNYMSPEKTPELYEKLLPYALALGVEHEWSEQFDEILAKAQAEGSYSPAWYTGSGFVAGNYAGFASSLGSSFAGAIASSSMAPGSSGGGGGGFSGGGGSSGGGGGGGGGGGW